MSVIGEDRHERTCRHLRQRTLQISILNLMDENNPIDEISRIEAQLDELAEVSERCRKIIVVSKAAIADGAALLLVTMLGLFGSNQVAAIGSNRPSIVTSSNAAPRSEEHTSELQSHLNLVCRL